MPITFKTGSFFANETPVIEPARVCPDLASGPSTSHTGLSVRFLVPMASHGLVRVQCYTGGIVNMVTSLDYLPFPVTKWLVSD